MEEKVQIEERVIEMLKTVYDPEIPVNVYDLGLIYKIDLADDYTLNVDMTLTAPNCPAADFIVEDVRSARRFLRKVDPQFDIDGSMFYELNKHTSPEAVAGYLKPKQKVTITEQKRVLIHPKCRNNHSGHHTYYHKCLFHFCNFESIIN